MSYRFYVFLVIILLGYQSSAQLVINQNLTPAQLVNKLVGPGIQILNVQYNGSPDAIGFFNGTSSNIGVDSGIVLSTGFITDLSGPNQSDNTSGSLFTAGDLDLDLLSGFTTFDAAILEFDFTPASNVVEFQYVFGSEEYNEFVCSEFNDVFGFFVSGPGFVGQQNFALVPNTNLPVTINNINIGAPGQFSTGAPCNLSNASFFVNNPLGINTTVELDGFSVALKITIPISNPCQTYHVKMAIADVGDELFDSAILLKASSFSSIASGTVYAVTTLVQDTIFEGCTEGFFYFQIPDPLSYDTILYFTLSGSAINGVDYTYIADSILIPAGDTLAIINISPINDSINEPPESVIASLILPSPCSTINISDTLIIKDYSPTNVSISGDTIICLDIEGQLSALITGGSGYQTFQWSNGSQGHTITISPEVSEYLTVNVTDICGPAIKDSILIEVQENNQLVIEALSDTICVGESALFKINPILNETQLIAEDAVIIQKNDSVLILSWNSAGIFSIEISAENQRCQYLPGYVEIAVTECTLFIPNIVTFNNDTKNDSFFIRGIEKFPGSKLKIFNRWGTKVFETDNYKNQWPTEPINTGVFFYILQLNNGKVYNGFITLIQN